MVRTLIQRSSSVHVLQASLPPAISVACAEHRSFSITEIIARWIQRGHNTLAFPACVRGEELLARFREQALCQVVQIREETGRLGFVKRSFY
jgi:hypothetical protein